MNKCSQCNCANPKQKENNSNNNLEQVECFERLVETQDIGYCYREKDFWLTKFDLFGELFGEDPVEYFIPQKGYAALTEFLIKNKFSTEEELAEIKKDQCRRYGCDFFEKTADMTGFLDIANDISDIRNIEIEEEEYCLWAAIFLASPYATDRDRENYLNSLKEEQNE